MKSQLWMAAAPFSIKLKECAPVAQGEKSPTLCSWRNTLLVLATRWRTKRRDVATAITATSKIKKVKR